MGLVTQQDPIGIAGGLNLYGYANGDPINFSDPFGLFAEGGCEEIFDWEDDSTWQPWAECMLQQYEDEDAKRGFERSVRENFSIGRCAAATSLLMVAGTLDASLVAGVGSVVLSAARAGTAALTYTTATLVGAADIAASTAPRVVAGAHGATVGAGITAHGYATGLPAAAGVNFVENGGSVSSSAWLPFTGYGPRINRVATDCAR